MEIKPNFIIACDQAFLTAGTNNLNLIGIFTNINAEQFPFAYRRFALVLNFDTDAHGMHTLETHAIDDEGTVLMKSELQINITASPFQVIANFENFSFPRPGKYELKLMLDGKHIGSSVIKVNAFVQQKTNIV